MADRISESLIDEILDSAKKYTGEKSDISYSPDKIDRLLEEITGGNTDFEKEPENAGAKAEKPAEPEKAEVRKTAALKAAEKSVKAADSEKPEKSRKEQSAKAAEAQVSVEADSFGQLSIAEDGVEFAQAGEEPVEEAQSSDGEKEENQELKPVSGQISIEKTRLFNEVKIRSEYNPQKPHNLGNKVARAHTGEAQPLVTPPMSAEKYRKHFMNKPVQNIEKTQEHRRIVESNPPKTYEKPGVVVRKSENARSNTDGLEPLPKLIPADEELGREKTRDDLPVINKADIVADNQIVIEGFDSGEEPIMQQSEEQAEAELRENRRGAVNEFVNRGLLFKQEVENGEEKPERGKKRISVAREFFGPKDKQAIDRIYAAERRALTAKTVLLSVIALAGAALAAAAGAENGNFEIYGNNEYIYVAVQFILLAAACVISIKSFAGALREIREKSLGMDTLIAASAAAAAIQCAAGFAYTDRVESTACLLTAAGIIPMILKSGGALVKNRDDSENFRILSENSGEYYCVRSIPDEEVSTEITRGLMYGAPDIMFSSKISFPSRFVEISKTPLTDSAFNITVPAVAAAALVIGAVRCFVSENIFDGISAFTGIMLMGLPAAAGFSLAYNMRSVNKSLNRENSFINGYDAANFAVESNGVIIDACDAFMEGGCNVEGIKLYHKMRIDEAIQYAASVIIASGGVLADVFNGVIGGKKELLLPVESLAYEERLGCSCWIHNHRVLVGNRELLVHHNVETPDRELEEKYASEGKNVIFLAIEGKIAAMFVVVYKADEATAKYLRALEKDGVAVFFRTADANITEEFIEREFDLPHNSVKIVSSVAGEMFSKIKNAEPERCDAEIIHNGSAKTMLKALHGAFTVTACRNASRIVLIAAAVIGIILVTALAFLSGLAQVGVWQIIIYQAVWTAVAAVIGAARKK